MIHELATGNQPSSVEHSFDTNESSLCPTSSSLSLCTALRFRYATERRNLADSIEELREIANGRDDIIAETAGLIARSWYASPATHVGHELIAAGMLILDGTEAGSP